MKDIDPFQSGRLMSHVARPMLIHIVAICKMMLYVHICSYIYIPMYATSYGLHLNINYLIGRAYYLLSKAEKMLVLRINVRC